MNSKPDIKCKRGGDIILVSENIANSIYWQSTIEAFFILGWILVISTQHFVGVG